MTCACIGNADDTAIVQACQLHATWAQEQAHARGGYANAEDLQATLDRVWATPSKPKATR